MIRHQWSALGLATWLAFIPALASGDEWGAVDIADQRIEPGERRRFTYEGARSFEGSFVDFPVFVARGATPGPTLCVSSGIHGDEVNSVEIARRVFAGVEPSALAGTLVVLPSINTLGFRTRQRNMVDRRDLNRAFPGSANGSAASIVAHTVFEGVVLGCSYLIDLHTGSNLRTNVPQVRVDDSDPHALELAHWFGIGIIMAGAGPDGSIRREATRRGIPDHLRGRPALHIPRVGNRARCGGRAQCDGAARHDCGGAEQECLQGAGAFALATGSARPGRHLPATREGRRLGG